tara:strand:- start:9248 stop:9595 length:348 start_codon:yes stop_codon:yes gene_type:complete
MAIKAYNIPNAHGSTVSDYFGPPAGSTYAITTMFFCNSTGTDATLDVWVIDTSVVTLSGSAPSNQYKFIDTLTIPAGDTFTGDTGAKLILDEDSLIYWISDTASAVNAVISYMEL